LSSSAIIVIIIIAVVDDGSAEQLSVAFIVASKILQVIAVAMAGIRASAGIQTM